jgi:ketosteroid isomerase-like protein
MSQENVELVRRAIEAWNRGDLDAIVATLHPDVEYVTTGLFPGLDPAYHGHDGFRRFWQDFRETWESLSIEIHELRDAGERVLLLCTFNARGRDGLEVRRQVASVATIRDGLNVRHENYGDWTTALEAVGLSEQDAHADS